MGNVKYVCVQPRLCYYSWQLEVMLDNFIKLGIDGNDIQILVGYSPNQEDPTNQEEVLDLFYKLILKFNSVKFYFYKDLRISPSYISSIRPNILKQHFSNFPDLKNQTIFYHDCDMVFSRKPDFEKFLHDDVWYLSDTISYIGSKYILSKGDDVYQKMCDIVGIDQKIPKLMEHSSGGAQYLMKGVDSTFWEKVEQDAESLYRYFLEDEPRKIAINPHYHPIQKWTADMWAVLWNAWYFDHETKLDSYFDFTWATDPIEKWDKNVIYHNAGVVGKGELFFKGEFINSLPYYIENTFNPTLSSFNYFKQIQETALNSCLL